MSSCILVIVEMFNFIEVDDYNFGAGPSGYPDSYVTVTLTVGKKLHLDKNLLKLYLRSRVRSKNRSEVSVIGQWRGGWGQRPVLSKAKIWKQQIVM